MPGGRWVVSWAAVMRAWRFVPEPEMRIVMRVPWVDDILREISFGTWNEGEIPIYVVGGLRNLVLWKFRLVCGLGLGID